MDSVEWIPSDDADVSRLSFTSDREPRILKMATHGIRAVWREIGAFPAMRRLGIPEVLQFEHTSDDLPDLGIDFHVTRELAHPQQASHAMPELWSTDRARALDVARWLGDCTRRIESLDWRRVPRANSPERSADIGADWGTPQYGQLLARSHCPTWARTFIDHVSGTLSRPEAFDSFGGWGGELLQARDGRFVLIDWPGLGAAPRGSLAALALEILLRFGAADPYFHRPERSSRRAAQPRWDRLPQPLTWLRMIWVVRILGRASSAVWLIPMALGSLPISSCG